MATEYKLPYTASEVNQKLAKIDSLVATVNGNPPDANGNVTINVDISGKENVGVAESLVAAHNTSTDSHSDIRTIANAALPKSGGTMTGALTLSGNPTSNLHAATKQYVDSNKYTHPSTHPASMITGLSDVMSGLGYSKIATGRYVGTYDGEYNSDWRDITLPFSPTYMIVSEFKDMRNNFATFSHRDLYHFVQESTTGNGSSALTGKLLNNILSIRCYQGDGLDVSQLIYAWVAFA